MINILDSCCNDATLLRIIFLIKQIIKIMCIVIPIFLIILITIDLYKNVVASNDNEQNKNVKIIVRRIIYSIAIFFVPAIINLTMNIVDKATDGNNKEGVAECWKKATAENVKVCNETDLSKRKAKEEMRKAKAFEEANRKKQENLEREKKAQKYAPKKYNDTSTQNGQIGSGQGGAGDCKGSYAGPKYSLTTAEKQKLAGMVISEYSNDIMGMKAVASQMANLYEKRKYQGVVGGKSLYDYITTCGWYASDDNPPSTDATALQAVEDVLVNGNRTLPLYIDEFDMYPGDIIGAYSMSDSNSYQVGVTRIVNVYGSSGTYYCITKSEYDANIYFYTSGAESYRASKGYSKGY